MILLVSRSRMKCREDEERGPLGGATRVAPLEQTIRRDASAALVRSAAAGDGITLMGGGVPNLGEEFEGIPRTS